MHMTTEDYLSYISAVYQRIHGNKEYISGLDAATGDGDHWANMDMGFEKIVEARNSLEGCDFGDLFKKIGMIMMTVIGGSGGVLYGSAYMAASRAAGDKKYLEVNDLCKVLEAMLEGIMKRGNAKPGMKTMIDALHPAVESFREGIAQKKPPEIICADVIKAAKEGAEGTSMMEAVKGRAYYQPDKGIGHLDPGAVTMYYQIEELMKQVIPKGQPVIHALAGGSEAKPQNKISP